MRVDFTSCDGQQAAIGTQRTTNRRSTRRQGLADRLSVTGIPPACQSVTADADERFPVMGERGVQHQAAMPHWRNFLIAVGHIPDSHRLIPTARNNARSRGVKLDIADWSIVKPGVLQHRRQMPGRRESKAVSFQTFGGTVFQARGRCQPDERTQQVSFVHQANTLRGVPSGKKLFGANGVGLRLLAQHFLAGCEFLGRDTLACLTFFRRLRLFLCGDRLCRVPVRLNRVVPSRRCSGHHRRHECHNPHRHGWIATTPAEQSGRS